MNKTSLLMLIVGTILGIVIGYVTFSPKYKIEAEGFGQIGYEDDTFKVQIIKRVDANNLKVSNEIQFPAESFAKSYFGLERLMQRMIDDGRIRRPPAPAENGDEPTQE